MAHSNETLWDEQRRTSRNIWKRASVVVLGLLGILVFLSLWLAQPLLFAANSKPPLVTVAPDRLEARVRKLSNEFYPRNYLNLENLNRAADYIKGEFQPSGGDVSEQAFTVNGGSYRNIIVGFGPQSAEKIVIGAHYDAASMTHGADDNASGVAGLLELADLFGKNSPPIRVELVAFSLEEPPFFGSQQMGSFVHAQGLKEEKVRVRLMICLEMIGYFSDRPGSQGFPLSFGRILYPDTGNFIAIVGDFSNVMTIRNFKSGMRAATSLPVYSINAPSFVTGVDFSDHRNYWQMGYDALMITDSAFYRNKNYHTIDDTYEKLDYVRMAQVVQATYAAVLRMSE